MEINKLFDKLEQEIKTNNTELKQAEELERLMEIKRQYHGDDEVISSLDMQKWIEANKKKTKLEVKSGIPGLDKIVEGFRGGNVVVISAPTKHGKTTFCRTLTTNFIKQEIKSLWFSYEEGPEELLEKFGEHIPLFYLPRIAKENTIDWIEEKIIESIAKFNTKTVFIDHLHFIVDLKNMARGVNVSLYIGSIMRELKKLALRYNIIIFLVSHITKTDIDSPPSLGDLRDSSFIAQESDFVIFLWRLRDKTQQMPVYLNDVMLSVQANRRNGKTGLVKLKYTNGLLLELEEKYERELLQKTQDNQGEIFNS